jgi:hypothetical protein
MIDVVAINDKYHVGREKPGGKIYVMGSNEAQVASYSAITETLEWYCAVSPEETTIIEGYLRAHY